MIHFDVLVTGWNCAWLAGACYRSIRDQEPGNYTYEIHCYDDGSDDGTADVLKENGAQNVRIGNANMGPAYARDALVRHVTDPNTICVMVDMDDALSPNALSRVAKEYQRPDTWMTFGNWRTQYGRIYAGGFFPPRVIAKRTYRKWSQGCATALRTFKRFLYDGIDPQMLRDENGNWLRVATDRAISHPMLEQCQAKNIRWIEDPIYIYNEHRPLGSISRYGLDAKYVAIDYLKKFPPVAQREA